MGRAEIDGDQIQDETIRAVDIDTVDVAKDILGKVSNLENIDVSLDLGTGDLTLGVSSELWDHFLYILNGDFTIPINKSKIIGSEIDVGDFCLEVNGILEVT